MTRRRTVYMACCSFALATCACGEGSGNIGAAGSGPGAGDGSTTDSTTAGGGGGITGDASGVGGQPAGSGGAVPRDATDADETLNLPPRPEWTPMLPLGAPGWRQSTTPFCSQELGILSPRVWSNADAVYVLIHQLCNTSTADSYPCNVFESEAVYRNDGSGWARVYGENGDTPQFAKGLTGLSTGSVVLSGSNTCPVNLIDAAGSARCVWAEPAVVEADTASVDNRLYVLFGDGLTNDPQVVREYDGQAWTDIATIAGPEQALAIAANGDTVAVSGIGQLVLAGSASAGALNPLSDAPAGDYLSVWVYDAGNIVLGNGVGHLVLYDGAAWTVVDTGTADDIIDIWGAPDGTVYFITQSQFGRLVGGRVEMFTVLEALTQASHYFADIWGNTSSEVFVTVNDRDFGVYDCGTTFLLWFDGELFHPF